MPEEPAKSDFFEWRRIFDEKGNEYFIGKFGHMRFKITRELLEDEAIDITKYLMEKHND